MNKTRKILLAVMACVVLLFATACGKDNTPFSHGSWSGNTYTSEFFGIKVQLGSDWTAVSDADLARSSGIPDMSETSIRSRFDKGAALYEMMAVRSDGTSMNITIQDSDKTVSLSEEQFFTAGIPLIKSQFEAAGYKCSVEKDTVYFLGKTVDCISLSLTANNVTVHEILVPVFKSHYTASINFGSLNKADLFSLMAMVSEI